MKTNPKMEKHELLNRIAQARLYHFPPNSRDTSNSIPPNTILIQILCANPKEWITTVSPTKDARLFDVRQPPHFTNHVHHPSGIAFSVNHKTVKTKLAAGEAYNRQKNQHEGPATITLALTIDQPHAQSKDTTSTTAAILAAIHSQELETIQALKDRAVQLVGPPVDKVLVYDPFEL